MRHQIDSYAGWTADAYGEPQGPFVPERDVENLRQGGAYDVLTPAEVLALVDELGPHGELHFNPLLAGIDPDDACHLLLHADFCGERCLAAKGRP